MRAILSVGLDVEIVMQIKKWMVKHPGKTASDFLKEAVVFYLNQKGRK